MSGFCPTSGGACTLSDMRHILVVKLADLGDVLTATPALRALRNSFPGARITALVTPHAAPLLQPSSAVDEVITFPKAAFDDFRSVLGPRSGPRSLAAALGLAARLRAGRFDALVLLHHLVTPVGALKYRALARATDAPVRAGLDNGRGAFLTHRAADAGFGARHEVEYCLAVVEALGARAERTPMEMSLSPFEADEAARRWQRLGLDPSDVAILHPGSGRYSLARRWSPERFAAVGDALASDGLRPVLVAGPGEEALAREVQQAMRSPSSTLSGLDVRALAASMQGTRIFVGNDSGVMHLAAAVGTRVVAVFGLSNHRAWGPFPPEAHTVVRLPLPCSPCFYTGHGLGTPQGCASRACLTDLHAQLVIDAARRAVRGEPDPAPVATGGAASGA